MHFSQAQMVEIVSQIFNEFEKLVEQKLDFDQLELKNSVQIVRIP